MDLGEKVNEFINKWKDKPKYFLYSSEVSALLKKVVLDTKYENDLRESQERWSVCDQVRHLINQKKEKNTFIILIELYF